MWSGEECLAAQGPDGLSAQTREATASDQQVAFAAPLSMYMQFAGESSALWFDVVGARVLHASFGTGTVTDLSGSTLEILFDSGHSDIFSRSSTKICYIALDATSTSYIDFRNFVLSSANGLSLHRSAQEQFLQSNPRGIAERNKRHEAETERIKLEETRRLEEAELNRRREREREQAERARLEAFHEREQQLQKRMQDFEARTGVSWLDARYHFWQLANVYDVPLASVAGFDPTTETYAVLVRIDQGIELLDQEIDLLASLGAPKLDGLRRLAVLQSEYGLTRDPWVLTKISSLWIEEGRPDLAMHWTSNVLSADHIPLQQLSHNVHCALLTTRGASLRRLRRRAEARDLALRVIGMNKTSKYAYCLLGGLNVDESQFAEAEMNFAICAELGGRSVQASRETEARKSSEFAAYLVVEKGLQWAAKYLRDRH